MKFIDDLIASIKQDSIIRKLMMGVHWTAVSSRYCGMASTVVDTKPHGEEKIKGAGELQTMKTLQLAAYAYSEKTLESSLGIAAINSLLPPPIEKVTQINAFHVIIEKAAQKTAALFGHFPYIDDLRKAAETLYVFELAPTAQEYSIDRIPELLPQADVIAITSNTIINHTLEQILPFIKKDAYSVMLGPSTPMSPVLFDYGISMLAGVRIINEDQLFRSISQGAIFRQVQGAELITWEK